MLLRLKQLAAVLPAEPGENFRKRTGGNRRELYTEAQYAPVATVAKPSPTLVWAIFLVQSFGLNLNILVFAFVFLSIFYEYAPRTTAQQNVKNLALAL